MLKTILTRQTIKKKSARMTRLLLSAEIVYDFSDDLKLKVSINYTNNYTIILFTKYHMNTIF